MNDQNSGRKLTNSEIIHRAARGLRTMTLEEKVALIRESEKSEEKIKARFVQYYERFQAPKAPETPA